MKTRRDFLAATMALSGVGLYSRLGYASAIQDLPFETDGVSGGTLTIALSRDPGVIVNIFTSASEAGMIGTKVFEGLMALDFNLNPTPELATDWAWSEDGLTFTVNLRKGVAWHDGEPFTSADVAFSMMEVWKKVHPYGKAAYANVVAAETPDDHTVIFQLEKPAKYMTAIMFAYLSPVVPKHVYENTNIRDNPANEHPIGTGAFKFKEWKRGQYITFEKNENYWKEGRPYLDQIVMRVISDIGARSVAFESNEVQVGYFDPLPITTTRRLEKNDSFNVIMETPSPLMPMRTMELNVRTGPLSHREVRQALMHGINRQQMINVVSGGYGKVATGPIFSTSKEFYSPVDSYYPYDKKKAEEMLDQAGFPRDKKGVRFKLTHDYASGKTLYKRMADFIKQSLEAIGVEVELRANDLTSFIRRVYTTYEFDTASGTLSTTIDPTIGVQRLYWSKNIVSGVPFSNASGYENPELDEILEKAQVEADEGQRAALWAQAQEIIRRDIPILNLWESESTLVARNTVHNYWSRPDAGMAGFSEVFVKE